jgi:hypothetical protein
MRGIAKLLFDGDADRLLGLLTGNDDDWSGMAERARRSGEWCGTTPGHGTVADAVRGASRGRRVNRPADPREF